MSGEDQGGVRGTHNDSMLLSWREEVAATVAVAVQVAAHPPATHPPTTAVSIKKYKI